MAAHVDLYARALGLRKAAKVTGVEPSTIQFLRRRVHGGPLPRLPNPGKTGHGKLSLCLARAIRSKRARGAKLAELAKAYGVAESTISTVCSGGLYPEPGQ